MVLFFLFFGRDCALRSGCGLRGITKLSRRGGRGAEKAGGPASAGAIPHEGAVRRPGLFRGGPRRGRKPKTAQGAPRPEPRTDPTPRTRQPHPTAPAARSGTDPHGPHRRGRGDVPRGRRTTRNAKKKRKKRKKRWKRLHASPEIAKFAPEDPRMKCRLTRDLQRARPRM